MPDLIPYIVSAFGGGALVLLVVYLNPDIAAKWMSLVASLVARVFRGAQKKATTLDIQSRVNSFVRKLNSEASHLSAKGVRIEWVETDEERDEFFNGNHLVIRLREHSDENRNFVNAAMAFTSRSLLPSTKRYLSRKQGSALDLFSVRKLLEAEKPGVVDRFFEDFFSPKALGDEKIMELLEKFNLIDKVGLYFFMLVQELAFLGEKVFYGPKTDRIVVEVSQFIGFLENYANRRVGDTTTPLVFQGAYCRTAIFIVAKSYGRARGQIEPYVAWIGNLLGKQVEQIYVLGSAEKENKVFLREIVDQATAEYGLEEYSRTQMDARIKDASGRRREVSNIVILLRSPDIKRYYDKEYQDSFMAEPTITDVLD